MVMKIDEEQFVRKREIKKERMRRQEHALKLANIMDFIDIQFLIVYPLAYVYAYFQTIRPYFSKY